MTTVPPRPTPDFLAARLRAGDASALAQVADATYGRGLAVARALTGDERRAERAVLDAYVALWLARQDAPDDAQLEAWVVAAVGRRLAHRPAQPGLWPTMWRRLARAAGRPAPSAPAASRCAGLA